MSPELSAAIEIVMAAGYRVSPPRCPGPSAATMKAVLEARVKQETFIKIARRLGLTKGQVAGITTRYRLSDGGRLEKIARGAH